MRDLVLHLKSQYFREVADGIKLREYRLAKPYWASRLVGKIYDRVLICDAFKRFSEDTVIVFPWDGFERITIMHEEFGPCLVDVFAIKLDRCPIRYEGKKRGKVEEL